MTAKEIKQEAEDFILSFYGMIDTGKAITDREQAIDCAKFSIEEIITAVRQCGVVKGYPIDNYLAIQEQLLKTPQQQ